MDLGATGEDEVGALARLFCGDEVGAGGEAPLVEERTETGELFGGKTPEQGYSKEDARVERVRHVGSPPLRR
ncbi:MAG TPA: hypothetical protein VEY13_07610 [Rubrobacteraceae bacterium]|nr:hypothetical protein [Rubrobacteraceae bacterium]